MSGLTRNGKCQRKKSVYYLLVETNNVTFISIRMTNVAFLYVQKPLAAEVAKTGCKWKNRKIQTQESGSVRERKGLSQEHWSNMEIKKCADSVLGKLHILFRLLLECDCCRQ